MTYIYYNVNVEELIRASHRLLQAISDADLKRPVGSRTEEENVALNQLGAIIEGYTGASL